MAADHENRGKMFLKLSFNSRYLKKARTKLDGSNPSHQSGGLLGEKKMRYYINCLFLITSQPEILWLNTATIYYLSWVWEIPLLIFASWFLRWFTFHWRIWWARMSKMADGVDCWLGTLSSSWTVNLQESRLAPHTPVSGQHHTTCTQLIQLQFCHMLFIIKQIIKLAQIQWVGK